MRLAVALWKILRFRRIRLLIILCAPLCFHNALQAQTNEPAWVSADIYSLESCDRLFSSAQNDKEKLEMQKDYWTLLGIVTDLATYRERFLRNKTMIDLFPLTYYHTTMSEMKKITSLEFKRPVEKMKQMITFYDAYKWNREQWDAGNKLKVEAHWAAHFGMCEDKISDVNLFCAWVGYVLTTGIIAHVEYDLPRAIRYSYANRFDRTIVPSSPDYKSEFKSTNELFAISQKLATKDVSETRICNESLMNNEWAVTTNNVLVGLFPVLKKFNATHVYQGSDVEIIRMGSWAKAFSTAPLPSFNGTKLLPQPVLKHAGLMRTGMQICPPEEPVDTASKTLPEAAPVPVKTFRPFKPLTATPTIEALGRVMLTAIKNNDKKLWMACVHPLAAKPDYISESLDRVRARLEEGGVTNWQSLKFSRVKFMTYSVGWAKDDSGIFQGGFTPGDEKFKGEFIRRSFKIEFSYHDLEFVGVIGDISIMTVDHKNWLMLNPSSGYINRNN